VSCLVAEKTDRYKDSQQPLLSDFEDLFIPCDSLDSYDSFVRWSRIGNSLEGKMDFIQVKS
jgi:hypothetical protein